MKKNEIGNAILYNCNCLEMLRSLPDESINCCITSPPYWNLRHYGVEGEIGSENSPEKYVANLKLIYSEVRRVLTADGTIWLNLGDAYKNKQLLGLPWRTALALQEDGWLLRCDIIWQKPNAMPQNVNDRPSIEHEYIFLLTKSRKYYYDAEAILEPLSPGTEERYSYGFGSPDKKNNLVSTGKWHTGKNGRNNLCGDVKLNRKGRNKRSVWKVTTKSYKGAHFAVYPPDLIEPCILAGCPEGGTVLDIFAGSGTTGVVALENNRNFIGCELNEEYYSDILVPRVTKEQDQLRII
jgi:DNA modification methylase